MILSLPPLNTLNLLQSLWPGSSVLLRQNLQWGWDNWDTCSTNMLLSEEDIRASVSTTTSTEAGGTMDDLRDCGIKDDRLLCGQGDTFADLGRNKQIGYSNF